VAAFREISLSKLRKYLLFLSSEIQANPFVTYFILLYTYGLFNDAVNSSDYKASNGRMIMNNELETIGKEAAVA
jgi:hypothetical protein